MTAPNPLPIRVEMAPGADPRGDPALWQWVDITGDVRASDDILITFGVREEGQHADPRSFAIKLNNRHGRYTPANPLSPYYGKLSVDTPVRVLVDWPSTSVRATGYAVEWPTRWDLSGKDSWVLLRVAGEKRRLLGRQRRPGSALARHVPRSSGGEQLLLNSNPTFETDASGWETFGGTLTRSTEQAQVGAASGKFEPFGAFPVVRSNPQARRVVPGRNYTFSLWLRPTTADVPLVVFIDWFGIPGQGVLFLEFKELETTLEPDTWALVTLDAVAPDNANGARAGFMIDLASASGNDVFFDEARLIGPRRSHVVAYWSFEDEGGREFSPGIPGVKPGTVLTGPVDFQSVEKFGSEPLPTFNKGASYELNIPWFQVDPEGEGYRIDWVYQYPEVPSTFRWFINLFTTSPNAPHWRVMANDDNLRVLVFGEEGNVHHTHTVPRHPDLFERWLRCRLRVVMLGTSIAYSFTVWNLDTDSLIASQLHHVSEFIGGSGHTLGRPTTILMTPFGEPRSMGHWTVSDNDTADPFAFLAYNGFPHEPAGSRITRLCTQERVPLTLMGDPAENTELMGPQPIDSLLALLRQAADVDGPGLLTEAGLGRPNLAYRIGRSMLAQEPSLTLTEGQLSRAPEPTDDDQRAVDQVILKSPGGTKAAAGSDTPRRSIELERNPAGPNQLRRLAERELQLRAPGQLRWPEIAFSLIAHPELAADWLAFRLGDRLIYDHQKTQIPGVEVDLIVEGGTERIGLHHWDVTLSCRPADPWLPARFGDDESGNERRRWDTEFSITAVDFDAGSDTSLIVDTPLGPLWTTDSGNLPLDVAVEGGVVLRVTDISGSSSPQTFTVEAEPVNGISKPIPAGAKVHLHRRPRFGL